MTQRHPIPAVLAVVVRDRQVLLVQRANPPDAGKWGFPGGRLEWGESLSKATLRELAEETGVVADYLQPLTVLESVHGEPPEFHYILLAGLCRWRRGEPLAADDAMDARWFDLDALEAMGGDLSLDVAMLARLAISPDPAPEGR